MDPSSIVNLAPILQYGFAAAWLIQFVAGIWIFVKGLDVLASVRDHVAANTAALQALEKRIDDHLSEVASAKEEIMHRPCQMTIEQLRDYVRRMSHAT